MVAIVLQELPVSKDTAAHGTCDGKESCGVDDAKSKVDERGHYAAEHPCG